MSKSLGLKVFVAVVTALALVLGAGSVLSVVYLGYRGLYTRTPDQLAQTYLDDIAWSIASDLANQYAYKTYGDIPAGFDYFNLDYESRVLSQGLGYYTLEDSEGRVLESTYDSRSVTDDMSYGEFGFTTEYPVVEYVYEEDGTTLPMEYYSEDITTQETTYAWDNYIYYDEYVEDRTGVYHIMYFRGPELTVKIWLAPEAWSTFTSDYWWAVNVLYELRYAFILGIILGVSIFLAGISYLTWAVGTRKGREGVKLVGLNRLPLDIYGAAVVGLGALGGYFAATLLDFSLDGTDLDRGLVALACLIVVAVALLAVIYYCAVAAQVKMGNGYWWRNSLVGRVLGFLWKYIRKLFKGLAAVFSMLPLIWQWLLAAGFMLLVLQVTTYLAYLRHSYVRPDSFFAFMLVAELLISAAFICYIGYAFGVLMQGAQRMSRGDLTRKVPTRFLVGAFRDMAENLNALADVAVEAAGKQLKSERMKTELITNVSHDIKTPLTSIINFVDLLRKPHTPEQEQQYLEVLDRQSQRMKKLIEDLMELSKATTGNLQVNPAPMDICEAVNQALGEFGDKLDAARLIPVLNRSGGSAAVMADGRLVWRVLSNVLSNVVKYALPGTRIYLDVVPLEDRCLVSVKNISREQLNLSAEELMERFVRGDASRNTEGSGLGLNIARSLMELQGGRLQLLVDGDLFKVTLVFPRA